MTELAEQIRVRYKISEGKTKIDPHIGDEKNLLGQIAHAEMNIGAAELAKQTLMEYCQFDLVTVCEDLARDMTDGELIDLTDRTAAGLNESHFKWILPGQEGLKHGPAALIVAPNHHQALIKAVRKHLKEGEENLRSNPSSSEAKQVLVARVLTAMGIAPYYRQEISALIQSEIALDKRQRSA